MKVHWKHAFTSDFNTFWAVKLVFQPSIFVRATSPKKLTVKPENDGNSNRNFQFPNFQKTYLINLSGFMLNFPGQYCWWTKSCTTKDDDYPIIYRVLTIAGGAGFCRSTVCWFSAWFCPSMVSVGKLDVDVDLFLARCRHLGFIKRRPHCSVQGGWTRMGVLDWFRTNGFPERWKKPAKFGTWNTTTSWRKMYPLEV